MSRLIRPLALISLLLTLAMAPALAQETVPPGDGPAVVVDEGAPPPSEADWTFRFLIPTVLLVSGLVVAGVVVGYGVRVRGRYRVVR